METVPEKALENLIIQAGFATGYEMSMARDLARDVRLLCFFRAINRGSSRE
jgi:hypothetical protein